MEASSLAWAFMPVGAVPGTDSHKMTTDWHRGISQWGRLGRGKTREWDNGAETKGRLGPGRGEDNGRGCHQILSPPRVLSANVGLHMFVLASLLIQNQIAP